jgi:hypothetical protein
MSNIFKTSIALDKVAAYERCLPDTLNPHKGTHDDLIKVSLSAESKQATFEFTIQSFSDFDRS